MDSANDQKNNNARLSELKMEDSVKAKYPPSDSLSTDEYSELPDFSNTDNNEIDDILLTLDTLPIELLMYISNFLDARFIIKTLSNVCQSFYDLFSRDIYWKTRISKRWPKPYPPVYDENFDWKSACIQREELHRVWSNPKDEFSHVIFREGIFAPVDTVHLMKEGTLLATGSRDRYLNLLDVTKCDPSKPETVKDMKINTDNKAHKGWIWSMTSCDDMLYTGSWDTYIKTWDLPSGCKETTKYKCRSAVLGLHAEPNLIVASCYDTHVYTVDPRDGEVHRKKYHRRPVLALAVDDKYIITGSEDKTIAVFDRRAGHVYKTIKLESYAMDISFGHQQLWIGDKAGNIHLYNTTLGQFEFVETYEAIHTGKVSGIIYTPGALFTCSTDRTIKIFEPSLRPGIINTLREHNGEVARLSYQSGVLASAGSDVSVGLWIPKHPI